MATASPSFSPPAAAGPACPTTPPAASLACSSPPANCPTPPAKAKPVAVEFDTTVVDSKHLQVALDLGGSVRSVVVTRRRSAGLGRDHLLSFRIRVAFDTGSKNLTVTLTDSTPGGGTSIYYAPVDLQAALPTEWVDVGFSVHYATARRNDDKQQHQVILMDIVVPPVAAAIVLMLFGGAAAIHIRHRRKKINSVRVDVEMDGGTTGGEGEGSPFGEEGEVVPRIFSYRDLETATGNFNEERKIGRGAFGTVYLGVWGGSHLAIKRLVGKEGDKSFKAEVKAIGRLNHRNLVRLVGWCVVARLRQFFIVYDYMPNRSLDLHLFVDPRPGKITYPVLPWAKRYTVAFGLASALRYLHEDCQKCVVHRDVKPANVMLDADFNARLGDFGLAMLVNHGQSLAFMSANAGTPAYMAPEVYSGRRRSSKESDVYSFGVVALEMASGRRASFEEGGAVENLVAWVRRRHLQGGNHLLRAADERLGGDYDEVEMRCLIMVGLWCTLQDRTRRPAMSRVVQYLAFDAAVPDVPSAVVIGGDDDEARRPASEGSNPPSISSSSIQHVGR